MEKPILKPPGGSYSILPEVVFMDEANPETSGRVLINPPGGCLYGEANPETSGRVLNHPPGGCFHGRGQG